MFYLSLLYPSLIFDMFLSLCMLEWFSILLTVIFPLCGSVCLGDFFCVCMCGLKFSGNYFFNNFCLCVCMYVCVLKYIYIYIYICMYVCVCVC